VIQRKSTTKFVVSGVVMDCIDDMFVVIACLVSTEDAENPDDVKQILNKFLDKNAYPDGKLPCIPPPKDCVSQSNGKYATNSK
jgi:hypothetical protein